MEIEEATSRDPTEDSFLNGGAWCLQGSPSFGSQDSSFIEPGRLEIDIIAVEDEDEGSWLQGEEHAAQECSLLPDVVSRDTSIENVHLGEEELELSREGLGILYAIAEGDGVSEDEQRGFPRIELR
jgi:hypothetical protein